ncbi:MAG: discoidin domain-containing protein, partial [Myxococcota bacterium]|nr:discoidin domain-containing protein [Myxococcota bacterium]
GDDGTFWQSSSCLPTGFMDRSDLNLTLDACADGLCTSSSDDAADSATDNDVYTGFSTGTDDDGIGWLEITLPSPQAVERIVLKGSGSDDIEITAQGDTGEISIGAYTTDDAYSYLALDGPEDTLSSLRLTSASGFTVSELAVLGEPCFEQITMDFGETVEIGLIRSRHYAGGSVTATTLLSSEDGETWESMVELDSGANPAVTTRIDPPVQARYLALRHDTEQDDYVKVYLWEIDAWDSDGIYGPRPDPVPSTTTLAQLVGVNSIWGWGTGDYSTSDDSVGPDLYAQVASQARNYHNMCWDVNDPDNVPDYETMAEGGGTEAQYWLDWNREYEVWQAAGMSIAASIQFTEDYEPAEDWDDPYTAAYGYGEAFAAYFGPSRGNGLISAMEVGNEPWSYTAGFYQEVLLGMAEGARAGDPEMIVMPSSLSATGLVTEDEDGGYDLGSRVTEDHAPYLDALNAHIYSFWYQSDGTRTAVYPEHRDTMFQEIQNILAWRDANMPGTPVRVTEWGWDSDGGGEDCNDDECVSEQAQALYAVRGALMLARWGIERSHWYFYANLASGDTLFTRSGLTGSANVNFERKRSWYALKALVDTLGERVFL